MKNILLIGCGWEQYELAKEIKKQGCFLIATHPFITKELLTITDSFFIKDSRDIHSHLNIAKSYDIDGVISDNCDYSLQTAAIISESMGLNSTGIRQAEYSNNKFLQRERCESANINQPKFFNVRNMSDLNSAVSKLKFPLVVKPVDSRGTFGVNIIKKASEVNKAFLDGIKESPSRNLICEEFIEGTLITVDGFCFSNGHRSLTVASRKFMSGSSPVTKEIIYPSELSEEINQNLRKFHHEVVTALNYKIGHTHGEYIVNVKDEIYLVECTNRGGGVYTSSTILPELTELPINEVYINQILGEDKYTVSEESNYMKKSLILTFQDFEIGKIMRSINLSEVQKLPYVLRYRSLYKKNDMIESIENCSSRHSMLLLKGNDLIESKQNLDKFNKTLEVKYY